MPKKQTTAMTAVNDDARFSRCLAETLKWEGGYSNDPVDPGGPTMRGVTQRVYDAWRKGQGLAPRAVRQIEQSEFQAIYRMQYWDAVQGDELPAGVDLAVFDLAVNSGPTRALKTLQSALGLQVDAHIGVETLHAVRLANPDALVVKIMARRRAFLKALKTYWRFGKGWARRCTAIEVVALKWAGAEPSPTALAYLQPPLDDADAQSATQGRAKSDPHTSMLTSTTGNTAIMSGGAGGTGIVVEASKAANSAYADGQIDWMAFLIALGSSPAFWTSVAGVLAAVVIWHRRKRQLIMEGV